MDDLLDGIYLTALFVALWGTGLGLGMSHAVSEFVEPHRRPCRDVVFALFSVLVPLSAATVLGRRVAASPASALV